MAGTDVPAAPDAPEAAHAAFRDRLPLAQCYADLLAGPGTQWGLLGPRETPRLWSRHLLNCAALTDLLPIGCRLVDVGSGAGLPGIALAVRRADVRVDLVEPLERRIRFLDLAVDTLGLSGQVRVVRGRAQDGVVRRTVAPVEVCTARALAPLDRLLTWCLPLLSDGGRVLAMKGERAAEEVASVRSHPVSRQLVSLEVMRVPTGDDDHDVTVVVAQKRGTA